MAWEKVVDIVGPPGTFDQITVDTIAADAPASATIGGTPGNRTAHFNLPQGLPGVNAVDNDSAVATYIRAVGGSQTRTAIENALGRDFLSAAALGVDQTGETPAHVALQAALNLAAAAGKRLKTAGVIWLGAPITPVTNGYWDGGQATRVIAKQFMGAAVASPTQDVYDFTIEGVEFFGGRKVDDWAAADLPRRATTTQTAQHNPSFTTAIGITARGYSAGDGVIHPIVERFNVINCHIHHTSGLPVLFRGVVEPRVTNSRFDWTMDPGFTFCKSPEFSYNVVTNGSDNGVSLSRGCTEIQCHSNYIESVAYYGIWAGGFEGDRGPSGGAITSNVIKRVGRGFIFLGDGPDNIAVSGNTGDTALNGPADVPSNNMGVAIEVSGISGGQPARGIAILSNQFSNCARGGIHLLDVIDVMIVGNQLTNMGSNAAVAGNSQTHNNAVFIDRRSSSDPVLANPRNHATRVVVGMNSFVDNRTPVVTNSPITNDVKQSAGFQEFTNYSPRALRNPIGEVAWFGGRTPTTGVATTVFMNSASGATRDFTYTSDGVRRWDVRVSGDGEDFTLIRRDDAGTTVGTPLQVRRSDGRVTVSDGPTILGATGKTMGFFGATGVAQPSIPANATDPGSTQNLVNFIAKAGRDLGLWKT